MKDQIIFEDSIGDGAKFVAQEKTIYVHTHSDWAGDTETGFGAECGFDLSEERVRELYQFLGQWLDSLPTPSEVKE